MDAVTATFHVFGKYIFPQLQTCSHDFTEGSFSSNIPAIAHRYLRLTLVFM